MLFTVTVLGYSTDEDLEVIHSWCWYGTGRQTIPETDCRREKGSIVGVDGTILFQESFLVTSSWYTSGCHVWSAGTEEDDFISRTILCDFPPGNEPIQHSVFLLTPYDESLYRNLSNKLSWAPSSWISIRRGRYRQRKGWLYHLSGTLKMSRQDLSVKRAMLDKWTRSTKT